MNLGPGLRRDDGSKVADHKAGSCPRPKHVIPAKAGIQFCPQAKRCSFNPAFNTPIGYNVPVKQARQPLVLIFG
jgi:hypothetical protein